MNKGVFLVRFRKNTYYSFASLLPILVKNFPEFSIQFIREKNPTIIADIVLNSINHSKTTKIFFFDSFMSVDVPIVKNEMLAIMKNLTKDQRKRLIAVAGGAHPTAAPINTLDLGFDISAKGEGEIIIEKIVRVILSNDSWELIPGIAYNDQGLVKQTPLPQKVVLDDYLPYSIEPSIHPPIEISRGCSFGCKFCQVPRILRSIRYRSLESIDKIVKYYYEKFNHRSNVDIRFISPNSLEYGSKDHRKPDLDSLWNLVKTVKKYPVRMFLGSFPSEIRPEFVNPKTVEILQQSDSKIVAIGAQSGNENMLQKMNRGHSLQEILDCVDYLLEGDLIPQLDFILGLPEETVNEMWDTVNIVKKFVKKNCHIRFHAFLPLPGTPWGSNPGTPVPDDIVKEVGALIQNPKVNGAFSKQLELVKPVFSYR
ncbi:MAG: (Dimethylallyl)adenosine tRNA methylthiotransferase MiaB [Candidatus Heimdallarchaeota archaeon LC_3]|nr:MAG: (Dimethylallyl)adenosine tRNA methylthiotransferase MiaB [Candidatus Heimdallarchaeota archaeon LC_3]